MTRLGVALFNYQNGGMIAPGQYRFEPLRYAFSGLPTPPGLILFCEGKRYLDDGYRGLHAAAEALSDECNRPYVGLLGTMRRGPLPPAIFYDPTVLTVRQWFDDRDPNVYEDKLNLAWFGLRASAATVEPGEARFTFGAWVQHWDPKGGSIRRVEATLMDSYGGHQLPIIGGGDLNGTASGPHWPQRRWTRASYRARSHKGVRREDGTWEADTEAVDHLIGRWDTNASDRVEGCGYTAVAEMAWRRGVPGSMEPTVNAGVDAGGGLLIDLLLANEAMARYVLAETYAVHIPDPDVPMPSDHRLITVDLEFPDA